jgi:hypothetical protein
MAIWASKEKKEWEWGQEVGLRWILEGQGVRYLSIQIGFWLPTKANFEKLMLALKGACATSLSSVEFWLPTKYCFLNVVPGSLLESQSKDVQPNQSGTKLHLGGKASNTRAKVKWDSLTLPLFNGGLGIIDPKAQSEALLVKLLVKRTCPRRRTLERDSEAPNISGPSPGAWQRAKHLGHKLAICRPQAQTNEMFILEEHPWLLA